jgi:hypothetical protein
MDSAISRVEMGTQETKREPKRAPALSGVGDPVLAPKKLVQQ